MNKRLTALFALVLSCVCVFAVTYSYRDNVYQKLAEEYSVKSAKALDAGEYIMSEDYALKAAENAALSEEFIRNMRAREDALALMKRAAARLDYARTISADKNYPVAFNTASDYYNQAQVAFDGVDYLGAGAYAQKVLDTLADIKGGVQALPKFYIVQPWEVTRDCLWNISGRTYVYNNPWLWRHLYEANKSQLPEPENPNLILPGLKLEIPSLTGEYRTGTYDPNLTYEVYRPNR